MAVMVVQQVPVAHLISTPMPPMIPNLQWHFAFHSKNNEQGSSKEQATMKTTKSNQLLNQWTMIKQCYKVYYY